MARVHVEDRVEQRLRQARPRAAPRRRSRTRRSGAPAGSTRRARGCGARPVRRRSRSTSGRRASGTGRPRSRAGSRRARRGRRGRRAAALDRALERRRGHPVHDDEHELRSHVPGLLVPRERPQTGVPLGTRTPQQRHESQEHKRNDVPERPGSRRAPRQRSRRRRGAPLCRLACRRAGAHRSRSASRRARRRGRPRFRRRGHPSRPDCQLPIAKPMPAPAAPASRMTAILAPRPPLPAQRGGRRRPRRARRSRRSSTRSPWGNRNRARVSSVVRADPARRPT